MAWCPHCEIDRPIQRQTFNGKCAYCGKVHTVAHRPDCRGPVAGALDVCTYCNTPLFAKVNNPEAYNQLFEIEKKIDKNACFVVTATMGNADNSVVYDMRRFRDEVLKTSSIGDSFINWYYKHGPKIADYIGKNSLRRKISYFLVVFPAYSLVKLWFEFKTNSKENHV